jgi:hypothetical protein
LSAADTLYWVQHREEKFEEQEHQDPQEFAILSNPMRRRAFPGEAVYSTSNVREFEGNSGRQGHRHAACEK